MSTYTERRGPLRGAALWRVTADDQGVRVLPDGVMDLMWTEGRLRFAGPDTAATLEPTRPGNVTWGLRLPPGAAHALIGVPAHELVDRRLDLADLVTVPASITDLAGTDPSRALLRVFALLWRRAEPDASTLDLAASLDRCARAGLAVPQIARRHDFSERSLRRLSDRLFGYGPKALMSIHRFQRALQLARSGGSLGDAAALAGFVDQPHFTRESHRLAGVAPGALLT